MVGRKKKYSEKELKDIIEQVEKLPEKDHEQIIRILIKHDGIKFSENTNGTFINISNLDGSIIREINEFVKKRLEAIRKDREREEKLRTYSEEFTRDYKESENDVDMELDLDGDNLHKVLQNIHDNKNLNNLEKAVIRDNILHTARRKSKKYENELKQAEKQLKK